MIKWLKSKLSINKEPEKVIIPKREIPIEYTTTDEKDLLEKHLQRDISEFMLYPQGMTQDSLDSGKSFIPLATQNIPTSLLYWYTVQGFIGYQTCAIMSQHWLIRKCCNVPARDAIQNGYKITSNDGNEVSEEVFDAIRQADITYKIPKNLEDFITYGRIFGVRVVMFLVESNDPQYYEKPFNIDGVGEGCYRGLTQIDPYWITPRLDGDASSDPASPYFYEPTYWQVNGKLIHRTHLIIFRGDEVSDILKPTYFFGGVPVPQQIYEKVYNAERCSNEATQLLLTKRSYVRKTDTAEFLANQQKAEGQVQLFTRFMDNYGQLILDTDDSFESLDTSLADLDAVIMTQYQLVASAAKIPATKLLGTSPKGFVSTGEYEQANYHEELKSIQNSDLTPLVERHHLILIKSDIAPRFNIKPFQTSIRWEPLDNPTALELAQLNNLKAMTDSVYSQVGAIDGYDIRSRIITDPESGYNGLDLEEIDSYAGGDPESEEEPLNPVTQTDPEEPNVAEN